MLIGIHTTVTTIFPKRENEQQTRNIQQGEQWNHRKKINAPEDINTVQQSSEVVKKDHRQKSTNTPEDTNIIQQNSEVVKTRSRRTIKKT